MAVDYKLEASLKLRDDFSKSLNKAKRDFKGFSKGFVNNSNKINKGFNKVSLGAVGMATGLFAGAWKAYGSYRELNNQLVRNQALMGASEADSKKLEAQVKKLGKTTIFTAKQVAEAQEKQIMAGYNTQEILETTPGLLKLSVASGEDLTRSSDIITDSLTAFGLGTKDLNNYLDVLAKTATSANTDINMMGSSFEKIATSSRNFGEDYREIALMLGVLADNGTKAERAGTGLNSLYVRLSSGNKQVKEAFKSAGVELYDQNKQFKGLRKIIMESKEAIEDYTPEQRNLWLATVAGSRGMSIWSSIMNTSAEKMGELEGKVYNATGSLDKFMAKMNTADQITFKKMLSAWDNLKLTLGKALSPIMLENMNKFTTYLNGLSDSGIISAENVEKMFGNLETKIKNLIKLFAAFKLAILGARAAAGDPTAIAELAVIAAGAGGYAGKSFAELQQKYDMPSVTEMREGNDNLDGSKVTTEKKNSAITNTGNVGPSAPVLNLSMDNVTFNNGADIDDFTTNLIDKLKARE